MSHIDPSSRRLVLNAELHSRIVTLCGAHPDLVKALNDAKPFTEAADEQVLAAVRRHCENSDSEIEIDPGAGVSEGDTGFWVEAWVWVPNCATGG